jgi:hypothetical protein
MLYGVRDSKEEAVCEEKKRLAQIPDGDVQ